MGNLKVYLKAIMAITLWGLSFLWSNRLLLLGIPPEYFVFVRILIGGLILFLVNSAMGLDMRILRQDRLNFLMLALCEPFIYFICETYGIQFTQSPTYSSLMISTIPLFSILVGVLVFKEKITLLNVLGVFVCLFGIVLVTLNAETVGKKFLLGLLLLLVAVFAEVGLASFTKALSGGYRPQVIVMYQFLIGSVFFLPLFFTKGLSSFDPGVYFRWEVFSPILCLAVLCTVVAFTLWVDCIRNLGVARSSIFQAMNPVVTAVAGTIIGQEILRSTQWAGIFIAVVGVIVSQLQTRRK